MTFSDFKSFVEKHVPHYSAEQWFSVQCCDGYSALYIPKFPGKSSADFTIFYYEKDDVWQFYAETSCVPIIRTFKSSSEIAATLQNMEVCEAAERGTNPKFPQK